MLRQLQLLQPITQTEHIELKMLTYAKHVFTFVVIYIPYLVGHHFGQLHALVKHFIQQSQSQPTKMVANKKTIVSKATGSG